MDRHSHLAVKYAAALRVAAGRCGPAEDPSARVARVAAADPTPKARHAEALVRWHCRGSLEATEADLARARTVLERFEALKSGLPESLRNPARLSGPQELADALSASAGRASGKELDRRSARKARAESEILFESSEGIVAAPRTASAARWWGRGTKWCTSTRRVDDSHFATYHAEGEVFVLALRDGRKFQWHSASRQRKDSSNSDVEAADILKAAPFLVQAPRALIHLGLSDPHLDPASPAWPIPAAEALEAVRSSPCALERISEQTDALCLASVRRWPNTLEHVRFPTRRIEEAAVRARGCALEFVRSPDEAIVRLALRTDPCAIAFAAPQTEELRLLAVRGHHDAISHVPNPSAAVRRAAVRAWPWSIVHIQNPDADLRVMAVQRDPTSIAAILDPDEALCRLAVSRLGIALADVPVCMRTSELCALAVKKDPLALEHVPESERDRLMVLSAVARDGRALKFVRSPNARVTRTAVANSAAALRTAKAEHLDGAVVAEALSRNGNALAFLKHGAKRRFMTAEAVLAAVSSVGQALRHAPPRLRTPEICAAAVARHGGALAYVPAALRTRELCLSAAATSAAAWLSVPGRHRNVETAAAFLSSSPEVLEFLPKRLAEHPRIASLTMEKWPERAGELSLKARSRIST